VKTSKVIEIINKKKNVLNTIFNIEIFFSIFTIMFEIFDFLFCFENWVQFLLDYITLLFWLVLSIFNFIIIFFSYHAKKKQRKNKWYLMYTSGYNYVIVFSAAFYSSCVTLSIGEISSFWKDFPLSITIIYCIICIGLFAINLTIIYIINIYNSKKD